MLHVKGKLVPGINASVDNDIINYRSGSVALVKFLEPISPMLNYFEYKILDKGTECAIGIGLGPINYPQVQTLGKLYNRIQTLIRKKWTLISQKIQCFTCSTLMIIYSCIVMKF